MVIFPLAPDQTIAQMWSNVTSSTLLATQQKQLSHDNTHDKTEAILKVLQTENGQITSIIHHWCMMSKLKQH